MIKFDEEVKWILGRPNFTVSPIAHKLRKAGQEIATKAEDEQAVGIYWMLCLYDQYGKDWRPYGVQFLEDIDHDKIKLNKQGDLI